MAFAPGAGAAAGGYIFLVPRLSGIPLGVVQGIPGVAGATMLQLQTAANGERYLDVLDLGSPQIGIGVDDTDPRPQQTDSTAPGPAGAPPAVGRLDLVPGVPQAMNGYEYTFQGQRSITGITVRKDPGSIIIWVATALLILGLGITFYLPRRRLWVKITPERTYMAGVADRMVNFSGEMRRIGAAAGSPSVVSREDEDD